MKKSILLAISVLLFSASVVEAQNCQTRTATVNTSNANNNRILRGVYQATATTPKQDCAEINLDNSGGSFGPVNNRRPGGRPGLLVIMTHIFARHKSGDGNLRVLVNGKVCAITEITSVPTNKAGEDPPNDAMGSASCFAELPQGKEIVVRAIYADPSSLLPAKVAGGEVIRLQILVRNGQFIP